MGKVQTRVGDQLSLYLRHLAWLGAKPKPPAGSPRAEKFDTSKAVSRIDQMKAANIVPRMPPLSAPHLFTWLTEMGLTGSDGMNVIPLPWREITAWSERTCIDLSPWESRIIRAASVAYVNETRRAEDETAAAPYHSGEVTAAEIRRECDVLDDVLG